jgi:hypothetical protein
MNIIKFIGPTIGGFAMGMLATKIYDYRNQIGRSKTIHEFSVQSDHEIDWRAGVGNDVVVNFQSFIMRDKEKLKDGPSLRWSPATGDKDIEVYHEGLLHSFESNSREHSLNPVQNGILDEHGESDQ